jgi:hypothetical protein
VSARTDRTLLTKALLAGLAVVVCVSIARLPGMAVGLAYLGPAVFAFLLLWFGRYPGETTILALTRHAQPLRAAAATTPRRRADAGMPRGGALLATALAGRAPP